MSQNNVIQYKGSNRPRLNLVVDSTNTVGVSDKPIFGVNITLNEFVFNNTNKVLHKGEVIGWVDYIDISQFACLSESKDYTSADNYLYKEQNQLVLQKAIKVHSLKVNENDSHVLFSFSPA